MFKPYGLMLHGQCSQAFRPHAHMLTGLQATCTHAHKPSGHMQSHAQKPSGYMHASSPKGFCKLPTKATGP